MAHHCSVHRRSTNKVAVRATTISSAYVVVIYVWSSNGYQVLVYDPSQNLHFKVSNTTNLAEPLILSTIFTTDIMIYTSINMCITNIMPTMALYIVITVKTSSAPWIISRAVLQTNMIEHRTPWGFTTKARDLRYNKLPLIEKSWLPCCVQGTLTFTPAEGRYLPGFPPRLHYPQRYLTSCRKPPHNMPQNKRNTNITPLIWTHKGTWRTVLQNTAALIAKPLENCHLV